MIQIYLIVFNYTISLSKYHDLVLSICLMDNSISMLSTNILELRDALGLSQKDFALLANISRTTLGNIESGRNNFKISSLDGILNFTSIKLEDLSKESFTPPKNLRERLMEKYKIEPSVFVILNEEPSIPYCIKYKLLKTNFLDLPKETNQIIKFFNDKYGWTLKGNSLHAALKRMSDLIEIQPHPNKQSTNLYSRRKLV